MGRGYLVTKSALTGKQRVEYACSHCGTALRSPLADAGKDEACPECGLAYSVPGSKELAKQQAEEEQRAKDEREAARAATHRERWLKAQAAARQLDRERARLQPRTSWLWWAGALSIVAGLITFVFSVFSDTSVMSSSSLSFDRVHNIGLLNNRLIGCMVGAMLVLGGLGLLGIASIGQEINRWGRAMRQKESKL